MKDPAFLAEAKKLQIDVDPMNGADLADVRRAGAEDAGRDRRARPQGAGDEGRNFVIAALVAGIHIFTTRRLRRGWPGHQGVYARLRRAMPGHDVGKSVRESALRRPDPRRLHQRGVGRISLRCRRRTRPAS